MDKQEPERAARLRNAPPWSELTQRVCDALRAAILEGAVRYGCDESSRDSSELRAVVQFPIGRELFDYFFNGHSGYRGRFRIGRDNGTAQNAVLISFVGHAGHYQLKSPDERAANLEKRGSA